MQKFKQSIKNASCSCSHFLLRFKLCKVYDLSTKEGFFIRQSIWYLIPRPDWACYEDDQDPSTSAYPYQCHDLQWSDSHQS